MEKLLVVVDSRAEEKLKTVIRTTIQDSAIAEGVKKLSDGVYAINVHTSLPLVASLLYGAQLEKLDIHIFEVSEIYSKTYA